MAQVPKPPKPTTAIRPSTPAKLTRSLNGSEIDVLCQNLQSQNVKLTEQVRDQEVPEVIVMNVQCVNVGRLNSDTSSMGRIGVFAKVHSRSSGATAEVERST